MDPITAEMKDPKRLFAWSWEGWRERRPVCIQLDMVLEAAVGEEQGGDQSLRRWSNGPLPPLSPTAYAAGSARAESRLHHRPLPRLNMPRTCTWMETSSITDLESPLGRAAYLFPSFKDMYAYIQLTHVS